jgi:hypothetical protein
MKGVLLLGFFFIFTVASLLVPKPMFPGNYFCTLIGPRTKDYVGVLSATFNGAFYGTILWLIFAGLGRKIGQ